MTETEWLSGTSPVVMLHDLWGSGGRRRGWISGRKLRLFACAACRQVWPLLSESDRRAVEVSERYADRRVGSREMKTARSDSFADLFHGKGVTHLDGLTAAVLTAGGIQQDWFTREPSQVERWRHQQADLLRHIVGNPFHPIGPTPVCSPVIGQLATALYDGAACEFALHDALLETGHADLAAHFAQPDHPKGCWALDAILGKK